MTHRRWLLALALSLLIHLMVIGSPGWRLPSFDEPGAGPILEAYLALQPAPAFAPAPVPPQPATAPKPRPPRPMPEATPPAVSAAAPEPAAVPEPVAPPTPAVPAAAPTPVELPWPHQGRIRFAVTRGEGEQAMLVGESIHIWQHDGEAYSVRTQAETVGLAALFRPVKVVQLSEGRLGPVGIVPVAFRVEHQGKVAEGARFDWENMRVTLYAGERVRREAALSVGAQDMLSQIYQMGLYGKAAHVELMVATGKSYGRYAYETVGDETLATRFGELRTWHVRTPGLPGEQIMELWLASDYRNLPVRIRFLDRKGDVYEQNAVEFEVDGARLATRDL